MNWLFDTDTAKKQRSFKKFLLAFFVCAAIASWIGISTIQADETDPGEYTENNEVNLQNAAQERHAKNLAIKMALQNDDLMDKVLEAKNNDDYDTARNLFKTAVDENMKAISNMRAEGYGWGYIAQYYDVHPKYLGLGHYKKRAKHDSSQQEDRGLALGHSKDKDGSHGVAQGLGNGHGNGSDRGGGRGGGKK